MKRKSLLLAFFAAILFFSVKSSAQGIEDFNNTADYKDDKVIFKLLHFYAPYNAMYQLTFLNNDGSASSSTRTPFSIRNGRYTKLTELQTVDIRKKLSDFVSIQTFKDSPMINGELYSAFIFNDGQKFIRYNFSGEIPSQIQEVIDFLNKEFNKADKIRYEEFLEQEKLLKEKYGDWLNKAGIVRPGTNSSFSLKNEKTLILCLKGYKQPVSEDRKTEIPIFYALIFYPEGRIASGGGSGSSNNPISKSSIGWAVLTNYWREKEFVIEYNAINFSVKIEDSDYQLKKGNLFIVRIDKDWKPQVTQLKTYLSKPTDDKSVISLFNKELGGELLEFNDDF